MEPAMPVHPSARPPRPPIRVIASPHPEALEAELAARVAEVKREAPLAPVLIIAPSVLLLDRLRRVLAERLGAALNLVFLYHRRIAEETLAAFPSPGADALRVASPALLDRLLEGALARSEGSLREYARAWPGARRALLATLRDLRDARVRPADLLRPAVQDGDAEEIADLPAIYEPQVPAWGARFRQVYHHGAYDLIGVHADLVAALAARVPVTWLIPAAERAPAFALGRRLAERVAPGVSVSWAAGAPAPDTPAGRVTSLFDETGSFDEPLPPRALELFHAQGSRAEATHAARLALAAVADDKIAPDEIAILARGMDAQAPLLLPALRAHGLRFRTSASRPLSSDPSVQAFLSLLRALQGDLERRAVVDLLRAPAFRARRVLDGTDLPFTPDVWDRWSRGAGVIRGRAMWVDAVAAWLAERRRRFPDDPEGEARDRDRLQALTRVVEVLLEESARWRAAPARWDAQAGAVRAAAARFLDPFGGEGDAGSEAVLDLLEDLARLDLIQAVAPAGSPSPARALEFLEEAIAGAARREADDDPDGVRVLDLLQARAVPFRRVILLGFNEGVLPRHLTEDPFLPDAFRKRLAETLRRAVPVRSESEQEDRALLALLVAGAEERLAIGWQRAGDDGRARTPSLALREITRLQLGVPDLDRVLEDPEGALSLPSHPREAVAQALAREGRLTGTEAAVGAACGVAGFGATAAAPVRALREALGRMDGGIAAGLDLIERTEDWRGDDLTHDGIIGLAVAPLLKGRTSVTALEQMGRCPLAFFFRYVLGVREMDDPAEASELEMREMGAAVHDLLRRVYDRLVSEEAFALPADRLAGRGRALVREIWDDVFRAPAARIGGTLPLLWEVEAARWREEVEAFVALDLETLAREGAVPVAREQDIEEEIDWGGGPSGRSVAIRARLDRIVTGRDGRARVGDYKTRGNPKYPVELRTMLRGQALQIPLYVRLAERWLARAGHRAGGVGGEILALGPEISPEARFTAAGSHAPDPGKFAKCQPGIDETVAVLLAQTAAGNFPMESGRHCDYCPYRHGCRRTHPPSQARIDRAPSLARLRNLRSKTQRKTLLSDLAGNGERGGEP
jgi:RecB family exonuclease